MELKNLFLSRFFKPKADTAQTTAPAAAEAPEPLQAQPPPEALPQKTSRHWLELPPDHTLYKLCALYQEQTALPANPEFVLEGPEDPCLPDREGEQELRRLLIAVTSSANKRYKQMQPQKKEEGEAPALPDLDAHVVVFLAKNNLTAWLLVYPPVGNGKPLDRDVLNQALEKQQVCFGVDDAMLNALPQNPDRYFRLFPVARGNAPVHGTDGQVIEHFPRVLEHKPMEDENHRIDYTNLGLIHNVEQGGEICSIILPTEGTPGKTVQNRDISARPGKAASIPKGNNTKVSEDGQRLVASIAGHVEFSGRSFQVKPVMDIPGNVDFSVGNISFLGDVCIRGDVCSGFTVRATGSITVDGVVEASTLEAGADLVVSKGVQGDNQAVLRAQRSIFAKYLENSRVYAKQDVETECIINCEVYCGGVVTAHSGHGKIIGGKVHAAHAINAGIIGSRIGNRTDIILGGHPCEDFDYELLKTDIQELERSIMTTERQPSSPDKTRRLTKMRQQLKLNQDKLDTMEQERELQVQRKQAPQSQRSQMKCSTLYPGTVLNIENIVHHVDDMLSPCLARLVDGEIQLI